MATEIELEKTYLASRLPDGLDTCRSEIIEDIFVPITARHPVVRLRHRGERYEITKKVPIDDADSAKQYEHTISLTAEEFAALATVQGKRFIKRRYYCTIDGQPAEVDVYLEALAGLVIIDFEFPDEATMAAFTPPDICSADISQEEALAGGILAGKSYADIEPTLQRYNYQPLTTGAAA